jgi:tetratricopeptide (TPR) repeat protein
MAVKKDKSKILEAAEKYIRGGKYQDAVNEYERLQEGEPFDVNIANVIGDLYLRLGREDRAVKTFVEIASSYEAKGLYPQSLAVYKKINKAIPDDIPSAIKLADLDAQLGFVAEAKTVLLQVGERLEKERHLKGLIFIYEKLIKLDRTDARYRLKLADLYSKDGAFDEAVEELNEAAEIMIESQELVEAEKLLNQARVLKKGHAGTLLNLVSLLRKRGKTKEAIPLLEEALLVQRDNLELLSSLGSLYIEDNNHRMGEEIFARLYAKYPNDINIRVKLGYTLIQQNKVDTAFQLYEPLINTLLSKGKEEKSIGLLGLLFTAQEVYIPALEKLAVIYKSRDQRKNLELALRVLLQEYRRKGLRDRLLVVLRELVGLCPDDKELAQEYAHLGTTPAKPAVEEKKPVKDFSKLSEQDQEMIRINLNKADLYLQQGLIRNAHRILENLLLLYPDEPRITQKIALVEEARSHTDAESLPDIGERGPSAGQKQERKSPPAARTAEERPKPEKAPTRPEPAPARPPEKAPAPASVTPSKTPPVIVAPAAKTLSERDRVTAADLFAELNLVVPRSTGPSFKYYDLQERISEEQALMEATYYQQFKKETAVVEKELADIITEFRRKMGERVEKENYDLHYNLGIAFLEQGLYGEAAEEFRQAALDPVRAVECYTLLSLCFRKKKEFVRARESLDKALSAAEKGSDAYFAVRYEQAVLLEEMNEPEKAITIYQEVKAWNPGFRDVSKRLRALSRPGRGRDSDQTHSDSGPRV